MRPDPHPERAEFMHTAGQEGVPETPGSPDIQSHYKTFLKDLEARAHQGTERPFHKC